MTEKNKTSKLNHLHSSFKNKKKTQSKDDLTISSIQKPQNTRPPSRKKFPSVWVRETSFVQFTSFGAGANKCLFDKQRDSNTCFLGSMIALLVVYLWMSAATKTPTIWYKNVQFIATTPTSKKQKGIQYNRGNAFLVFSTDHYPGFLFHVKSVALPSGYSCHRHLKAGPIHFGSFPHCYIPPHNQPPSLEVQTAATDSFLWDTRTHLSASRLHQKATVGAWWMKWAQWSN